jgi:hypothetical protein
MLLDSLLHALKLGGMHSVQHDTRSVDAEAIHRLVPPLHARLPVGSPAGLLEV